MSIRYQRILLNPSQQAKLLLCIAVNAAAFCCVLTANADENNTLVKNEQTLINHGEFQMKRMLSDRLQMNLFLNSRRETVYVDTTDTIYQWMVRRYAGVVTGGRIFWDPVLPKGFNADHSTPIMGDPATIRIANPSVEEAPVNTRFEKQWFWAVFEMHNLENSRGFADLFTRVARDQISREKFIQASAHLEYLAMKRTLKFYHNTWCKWAATSSFVTDLSIWQGGALPEFESWLQLFKK